MGQFSTLDDVLGVLRRRLALIIGITFIGAALSLFYATSLPRQYETTAVLQVELSDLAASGAGQSPGARVKNRLNLITQQLMARESIRSVIEELGLFAASGLPQSEQIARLREAVGIEQIVDPGAAWRPDAVPSGLRITVRWGDPEQAATIANTFLERILRQSEARRRQQTSEALSFFESEAARVGEKIAALESEIAAFKQQNADALPESLAALRSQLATLRETELEIDRQIIGLQSNAGRLREDALARQVAELEQQKALVADRIARIEAALAAAPEVEREYSRLKRDLAQLQEQLGVITRRRAEAEMEQALESAQVSERFEVLEEALVPEYPVAPSRKKIAVAGTMLFLLLGAALALVLEVINPAIRTAAQMERELGVVPIVAIPDLARGGRSGTWKRRLAWLAAALAVLGAIGAVLWPLVQKSVQKSLRLASARLSARARPRPAARAARPAPLRVMASARPSRPNGRLGRGI